MPMKGEGGRIETATITQDGPIAFTESTTPAHPIHRPTACAKSITRCNGCFHAPTCARVEVRRAFPQLLALIQASAILHFRQRHVDDSGSLIASITDYQIARRRIAKPFAQSLGGGLSDAAMKGWPEGEFTSRDAAKRAPAQRSSVYAWLGELLTTRRRRLPPMERSWRTR